ncbi:MAG: hypothetical protein H6Q68_1617 [Firmicutes bacterium]|nr:hypothetical protein [Bacillota bacterium]
MRERLLVAVLIMVAAVCEIMDVLSKIIYDYFFARRNCIFLVSFVLLWLNRIYYYSKV